MTQREESHASTMARAAQALEEARAGKWEAVGGTLREIIAEAGATGLFTAVTAWCDTLFVYQRRARGMPDELGPQEFAQPLWVDDEAGTAGTDADAVDPANRWVGQLLAARASMDNDAYRALLKSVPLEDVAAYLGTLLESVALGLNVIADGGL